MVDVGTEIRKAYYQALAGNITVNGQQVPVVDEKLEADISAHGVYVIMTSQDEDGEPSNKTYFVNETLLRLQIVNQRRATNTKEVVEDVADQILQILFPSRTSWALTVDSPLRLTYARFVNAQYNPLAKNDQGLIISKTLTFKNRITQN